MTPEQATSPDNAPAKPDQPIDLTQGSQASAVDHASNLSDRERKLAVAVVGLAFVMDLLDLTIVNIAIPTVQEGLGATYAAVQWTIAGYALGFATLLISGGRLGDIVGYKKLFLIGVSGFTIASLVCGIAPAPWVLIGGRIVQGGAAALMVPQVLSLVQVMYKPAQRTAVIGIFGALGGLAATIGPILGGFLIAWDIAGLDWRPIFLINIPVGIFALVAGWRYLPEGKSPHPLKLDVRGTILIMAALAMFIFPLIQGRELGWPWWSFAMLLASVPLFWAFASLQRKKAAADDSPLVVPSLFRVRTYNVGLSLTVVIQLILVGANLATTLTLQLGLGYSVIKAALTGLPIAVGISLAMGFLTPKLTPKLGRYVLTVGAALMAAGLAITAVMILALKHDTEPWHLIIGLFLNGLGMGLAMGLMFSVALKDVDTTHAGSASGTLNAFDQAGAAVAIALVGVIFFGVLSQQGPASFAASEGAIRAQLTADRVPVQFHDAMINGVRRCYVDQRSQANHGEQPVSCQSLQPDQTDTEASWFYKAANNALTIAAAEAFSRAFAWVAAMSIAVSLICLGLSFLLPRHIEYDPSH